MQFSLDKFKALMGVGEDDYYDDEFEEEEVVVAEEEKPAPFVQPRPIERKEPVSKVLNMSDQLSRKQFKLVVIRPTSFDECPKLVDNLKNNKPVIINLEKAENEVAKKIFDFLSGATYAIDGTVQKVATNIFVFAPHNVDVMQNSPQKKEDLL